MLKIPLNDTSRIFNAHKESITANLLNVANSGKWLLSSYTEQFATSFAKFCDVKYCLPVANGTDALEFALRAIIGNDTSNNSPEVITVANAGGYTTIACRLIGAIPVYVDINESNLLINYDSLLRCINKNVKAIVITHLYGGIVNIDEVREVLKSNGYENISIIEDCAQAHGGMIDSRRVGSFGDIAAFSFYPTKNLGAMGDAGAITTSDENIFKKIKKLHQYGWDNKYRVEIPFGKNSRMDEIQASILSILLPHLDDYNNKRKYIYNKYRKFAGSKLKFLEHGDGDYVGHLAVVKTTTREKFIHFMKSNSVSAEIHYPFLDNEQPGWKNLLTRLDQKSNLQTSRRLSQQIVTLPCFPLMTEEEIDYICDLLNKWEYI